ncbi:cytochrome c biogenesis protein CcdA [Sinobaca sp. H24]|uniref:cytochrome c biogenesis CcdA family protein n=1 Tax=Sinobaca sp. H24 TaxID=2923376 RepID=UPI0027E25576|nr:cytochrome c biogenesis protein CcdA [Sinobaca sp. H24]
MSPCIFPLIPAYLAQLTGTVITDSKVVASRSMILSRSIGFIMGFTIIFLLLGASSTFLGQQFSRWGNMIEQLGAVVIVLFGLQMAGIISIRACFLKRLHKKPTHSSSFLGSISLGLIFAAGWSPCIGLVLGSILAMASQSETLYSGMAMLLFYSAGLGVPFIIVALLYSRSLNKLKRWNKWLPRLQRSGGYIMIALGIMLFTGHFQMISSYLARFVPFGI